MGTNFAIEYPPSMKNHPYGHAFYEPELASVVRPASCGYLDDSGQWNPIADLNDEDDLKKADLKAPDYDKMAEKPVRHHQWGPKASNAVRSLKLSGKAAVSAAALGIPASASAMYEFWSVANFGALLICPSKVAQKGYYHRDPFLQWAKTNAEAILKKRPEVKTQGFWVVTTTYSTDDIWVDVWKEKDQRVTLGFKVDVVGAGEIAPSGEFYRGQSASGWTHSTKEVSSA